MKNRVHIGACPLRNASIALRYLHFADHTFWHQLMRQHHYLRDLTSNHTARSQTQTRNPPRIMVHLRDLVIKPRFGMTNKARALRDMAEKAFLGFASSVHIHPRRDLLPTRSQYHDPPIARLVGKSTISSLL